MAFADNPGEWDRLVADPSLMESAVEEVIRWATPVLHMRRTAAVDTELAGTKVAAGDKVVMWYAAANRDPEVFADPFRFDIGRDASQQVSFGGGGPHFCLGAFLARMEIQILLEEMVARGSPSNSPNRRCAPSNFVHGVLSVGLAPRSAS